MQRTHMQSDWHRYNLKRRVAALPPLSSEIFSEKVLANQATAAATAAKAQFEKVCPACQKTYFSENAFRNHLGSQKHKQKVASMRGNVLNGDLAGGNETESMVSSTFELGTPVEVRSSAATDTETEDEAAEREFGSVVEGIKQTSIDEKSSERRPSRPHNSQSPGDKFSVESIVLDRKDEGDVKKAVDHDSLSLLRCLFCNLQSESIVANLKHMSLKHGLFIPEQQYLVDTEGLIQWLHERVSYLHECLYCSMVRHTTSGIQTHMRDKGHCKIAFEDEEQMIEVGQFYDFTSTYSDDELSDDEDSQAGVKLDSSAKLGDRRKSETIAVNGVDKEMADADDEEWEDEDVEDEPTEPKRKTTRSSRLPPTSQVYHDEDGLHLPSGRTAGHRSLARYFRQNLRNYAVTEEERATRRAILNGTVELTNEDEDDDETMSDGTATPTNERSGSNGALVNNRQRGRASNNAVTRANGGLGMIGVSDAKKHEAKKLEEGDKKRAQRAENRWRWGVERRNNFQKHFRDPLLQ